MQVKKLEIQLKDCSHFHIGKVIVLLGFRYFLNDLLDVLDDGTVSFR